MLYQLFRNNHWIISKVPQHSGWSLCTTCLIEDTALLHSPLAQHRSLAQLALCLTMAVRRSNGEARPFHT